MKRIIAFATVVMLLMFSTVSVMAADSATAETKYQITIGTTSSSTSVSVSAGSISASANSVADGGYITLTATTNAGYTFSTWVIDGDYELADGYDLTDEEIVIYPTGDITVNAEFVDEDGNIYATDDEEVTTSDDESSTSPKTGESAAAVVITLLAACAVATVARKKIAE